MEEGVIWFPDDKPLMMNEDEFDFVIFDEHGLRFVPRRNLVRSGVGSREYRGPSTYVPWDDFNRWDKVSNPPLPRSVIDRIKELRGES